MLDTQDIIINLTGAAERRELGGREYLVAKATLVVPGVLNGNRGPILYTEEELAKDPAVWNHIPIVVDHPFFEGKATTARSPGVLNETGIGLVLAAKAKGKLTAELWFDVENTRRIAPDIYNDLVDHRPIELSTGLGMTLEDTQGVMSNNGRATGFRAIAREFRPDHLAILTTKKGACNIEDGCGVFVNENEETDNSTKETGMNEKDKKAIVDNLITNCGCVWKDNDRDVLNGFDDEKLTALNENLATSKEAQAKVTQLEEVHNTAVAEFKDGDRVYTFSEGKWEGETKAAPPAPKEKPVDSVINEQPKTDAEYISALPAGVKSVVQNALAWEASQKKDLIKVIVGNSRNRFTEEALATKDVGELQAIAAFAAPVVQPTTAMPAPSWAGASGAPQAVVNEDGFDEEDTLVVPVMNWAPEKAAV